MVSLGVRAPTLSIAAWALRMPPRRSRLRSRTGNQHRRRPNPASESGLLRSMSAVRMATDTHWAVDRARVWPRFGSPRRNSMAKRPRA